MRLSLTKTIREIQATQRAPTHGRLHYILIVFCDAVYRSVLNVLQRAVGLLVDLQDDERLTALQASECRRLNYKMVIDDNKGNKIQIV